MANPSPLSALYAVATDAEAGLLDSLTHRAGAVWTCAFCRWYNVAAASACEECARTHADTNIKDGLDAPTSVAVDDASLTPLFNCASDGEAVLLDDLSRRAGIIWTCFCHWHNPASAEICESCGRARATVEQAGAADWLASIVADRAWRQSK